MNTKKVIFMTAVGVAIVVLAGCGRSDDRIRGTAIKEILIDAPPEQVWNYLMDKGCGEDPSTKIMTCERMPTFEAVGVTGERGSTYTYKYESNGKVYRGKCVVTEWEPPFLEKEKCDGDIESERTWYLTPVENGTRAVRVSDIALSASGIPDAARDKVLERLEERQDEMMKFIKEKVEAMDVVPSQDESAQGVE